MRPRNLHLQGALLWLESLTLAGVAAGTGQFWLLPAGGVLMLLAGFLTRIPWPALAGSIFLGGSWIFQRGAYPPEPLPPAVALLPLALGVLILFLGIVQTFRKSGDDDRVATCLGRFAVGLHVLTAGIFLAASHFGHAVKTPFAWACAMLLAVLVADTLAKQLVRLYTPSGRWHSLAPPGAFFFYRWLGSSWRACLPTAAPADHPFHLRLPEMWMWPAVKRSLPALAATSLALVWLGTAVHEVTPGREGVRQTFGALGRKPLPPGIHLSLPWPFGRIHAVETATLHEVVLGFRSDPGKPILWERPHYIDEELSLVGEGDDFLSISIPILYRVRNPSDYLRSTAEADALLRNLANRLLLRMSLHRPAAEIMTLSRETLRAELHAALQHELDARSSGLLVCEVYFRDIHPPVPVAPAFQEVVSAIEEKEALIHEGEEYRLDRSALAGGDARRIVTNAEAASDGRLQEANGGAERFVRRARARAANPFLYDLREGFRTFDLTLAGARKVIVDEKFQGTLPAHLDFRRALNPKLSDHGAPVPEPLIPNPGVPAERFDPNVEGYH